MAKISFDRILPLLKEQQPANGVQGLLREIIVIQSKLDNLDKQDFYFQKGKTNHIARLESLKRKYAQIVEAINGNTVDYFLEQVRTYESNIQKLTSKGYLNTIDQMALGMMKGEIYKYNNLLYGKGRFGTLKPLDELMKDEQALMQIFE
jgi:predicted GTPase